MRSHGLNFVALWAAPAASLALAAAHLAGQDYPLGHDCDLHVQNAAALHEIIRRAPTDAPLFIQAGLFHYPPLGAATTALLMFVFPAPWAFHLTQLLYGALFALFFALLLREFTGEVSWRFVGMAAALASPQWVRLATSYNLEVCLATALAFTAWVMVSRRPERGRFAAVGWGVAVGVALLSKPVVALYLAPLAVWSAREASRAGRAKAWALFGLAAAAVAGQFYGPSLAKGWGEFLDDFLDHGAAAAQPVYYYLVGFFTSYAVGPLALVLVLLARRVRWRQIPGGAWACLSGAILAVVALSFFHTKRIWYIEGAHLLAAACAVSALATIEPRRAQRSSWALAAAYAALAVLGWFPLANPAARVLSLGTADYFGAVFAQPTAVERRVEQRLRESLDPWAPCPFAFVDFMNTVRPTVVAAMLAADDHAFAFHRAWLAPNEYWIGLRMEQRLPRACQAAVVIRTGSPVLTAEALTAKEMNVPGRAALEVASRALLDKRGEWIAASRDALDNERDLMLLRHAVRATIAPPRTWEELLDFHLAEDGEAPDATILQHFAMLAERGNGPRAVHGYQMFLGRHPDHPTATLGWIEALSSALPPEEEANALAGLLEGPRPPPGAAAAALDRLAAMERAGQVRGVLDRLALKWLRERPAEDETRRLALRQMLSLCASLGNARRAATLMSGDALADQDRGAIGDAASSFERVGRFTEAAFVYEAIVARWPDDAASWLALAACRRRAHQPQQEAEAILRLLPRFPLHSAPFREQFDRLFELAEGGVVRDAFAAWADRALAAMPVDDPWRPAVVIQLMRLNRQTRKLEETAAVIRRETAMLSDKEAAFALWDYAMAAFAAGDAATLSWLGSRLAGDPYLHDSCKASLADAREIMGRELAGDYWAAVGMDGETADSFVASLIARGGWLLKTDARQHVELLSRLAPWSDRSRLCRDHIAMDNAVNAIANEEFEQAAIRLRAVRYDPRLREKAREMLRALPSSSPTRSAGGPG